MPRRLCPGLPAVPHLSPAHLLLRPGHHLNVVRLDQPVLTGQEHRTEQGMSKFNVKEISTYIGKTKSHLFVCLFFFGGEGCKQTIYMLAIKVKKMQCNNVETITVYSAAANLDLALLASCNFCECKHFVPFFIEQ